MIEGYSFGRMVIDGQEYKADLIVFPDGRVEDSWWRKEGHVLAIADITRLVRSRPRLIIAGTGADGIMEPDDDLESQLDDLHIDFRALPTEQAVNLYNREWSTGDVGGCFHLTC